MSNIDLKNPMPEDSPTVQDLADNTRIITEHVDERTEAVRVDLAERTDSVRERVIDATEVAKTVVDVETEAVRSALAIQTEAVRQQVLEETRLAKLEMSEKTEETRQLLEEKHDKRRDMVDRKFREYRRVFVFATVVMLLANTALYYLYFNPRPGRAIIEVGNVAVVGPAELCPGDSLYFEFAVIVTEPGVYALDMSTWKMEPLPSTVIFSESQNFILGAEREFPFARRWTIPLRYVDPSTNESVEWTAGQYVRDIGFTAVGRNTRASILSVPFVIKSGCGA